MDLTQRMHTKLQAKLLLESTLENMDNHQLLPTPDNYRLWFEYAAGSLDQLNADIDGMISQQSGISQAICQQLFIKYIANKNQCDLDETRIALREMISVMVKHLKDWDSSSTNFCDSMGSCLSRLDDNPTIENVKAVIGKVTEEAKNIQASNFSIKASLHSLTNEISSLRQDVNRLGSEANIDALTETINRRGFDSQLQEITQKSQEDGFDCSLIVADVDNFKKINDNFGHQVGDKVLKYIAATLRKNIRGGDVLARYGGEEFAIILPHTSFEGAMNVAETIRQAISARELTTRVNGKIIGRITISAGVTSYRAEESLSAFFERADRFMYKAKNNGKDQVFGSGRQTKTDE